jgi:glutathione S-transferase
VRLYQYHPSGNCYKIRLLLNQLGLACERVDVDILKGESRTPEFLAINSNGRIPVLEVDGQYLPESNAALFYLASGTPFLPADRMGQAQVLRWMFFEQYSHEPFIATIRFWVAFQRSAEKNAAEIQRRMPLGYAALAVMEDHLRHCDYFVNNTTALPTSRSMPIPTWRPKAVSSWSVFPICRRGLRGCSSSLGICRSPIDQNSIAPCGIFPL